MEESNMSEYDITEADKVKHDKIEKAQAFERKINKAVEIGPELVEDVKFLKDKICGEGEDCIEKKMERQFGELNQKITKIEENSAEFVCDACGFTGVKPLSSFCPNCGAPIYTWSDDNGEPIPGWKHYSERNK
jgi:rubrerythrin